MHHPVLTLVLAVFVTHTASAEIYQWRDAQGRIHFSDQPAPHTEVEQVELGSLNTMTPVAVPPDLFKDPPTGPAAGTTLPRVRKGHVVMYSTPTCTFCGIAKEYMESKGIPYREKDIIASKSAEREFVAYGGLGAPLMLIGTPGGTRKLDGFTQRLFDSVYYSR